MISRRVNCLLPLNILAWFLIFSSDIIVDGSKESICPKNAVVDLTEETPDYFGSVNISGDVFGPETIWINDGKRLGCPCSFKTCISLCCPFGEAKTELGSCIDDKDNSSTLPEPSTIYDHWSRSKSSKIKLHPFSDDPCTVKWMTPDVLKNFVVLLNGAIRVNFNDFNQVDFYSGSIFNFEQYCLFREPESTIYLARVCLPLTSSVYDKFCLSIAALIMLFIFICYTVTPEFRNLHGLIFRSYLATYIGMDLCFLGAQFAIGSETYFRVYKIFVFIGHFNAISCAFWLNVMSFSMWQTFRNLQSIEPVDIDREKRKYVWYRIYAWIIPAILVGSCVAFENTFDENFKQWYIIVIIVPIYISNTLMYIFTGARIRRQKKYTTHLIDGVNKYHNVTKQWFKLYVKLFLVMGILMVMWIFWLVWPTGIMTRLILTLEVLQSFLIFYIFLCQEKVRQVLHQHFHDTFPSLNRSNNNQSIELSTRTTGR